MSPKTVASVVILSVAASLTGCSKGWNPQKAPPPLPPQQQADVLFSQVEAHVNFGEFDAADKAVVEIEQLQPNLPPTYAAKIEQAKKTIIAARAKAPK